MTPEIDESSKHYEELTSHELVHRYMLGEIPLDKYAKLFSQTHKGIDLLEMAFSEKELNKIYNENPSLRPKDSKNQRRSSLETFLDNCEDKKNQIIDKVVESLKGLHFLKK